MASDGVGVVGVGKVQSAAAASVQMRKAWLTVQRIERSPRIYVVSFKGFGQLHCLLTQQDDTERHVRGAGLDLDEPDLVDVVQLIVIPLKDFSLALDDLIESIELRKAYSRLHVSYAEVEAYGRVDERASLESALISQQSKPFVDGLGAAYDKPSFAGGNRLISEE